MLRVHLTETLNLIRARKKEELTKHDKSLLRKVRLWGWRWSAKEDKLRRREYNHEVRSLYSRQVSQSTTIFAEPVRVVNRHQLFEDPIPNDWSYKCTIDGFKRAGVFKITRYSFNETQYLYSFASNFIDVGARTKRGSKSKADITNARINRNQIRAI